MLWLPLPWTGMTEAGKGVGGKQATLAQMTSAENQCLPRRKALVSRYTSVPDTRAACHPPPATRADLIRKSRGNLV